MSRRSYDNSLRAEQAAQTRQRILTAAQELLADPAGPLTVPEVAARAGVSEPTVYRHFPSRAELLSAAAAHMSAALGQPPMPQRVEDVPAMVAAVALYFGRHASWFRAAIRNPHLREVRMSGRRGREERLRGLLAPSVAHLAAREQEIFFAALFLIVRVESWDHATRALGLSDEETGRAFAWLVGSMLDSVDSLRRRGATRLSDDELLTRAARLTSPAEASPAPTPQTDKKPARAPRASPPTPRPRRKAKP